MLERLVASLESCPLVKRGEYNYFIHPITDGVPEVDPHLLREVCMAMIKVLDLEGVDRILAAEAMGIPVGAVLSLATDLPMNIVRKREYKIPGEVAVHQATGYSKGQLFLNGVKRGDRVVIVDDVISTGGTTRALLWALDQVGAEVQDICFVIKRGSPDIGRPYKTLVSVEVTDRVRVVDRIF
ncbi:MAG: Hypoxanthine/guanine phosphoribosyltransferase [Methanoregulaceae archaeon PtaB.Bin056]|nr:MAG: Hypoxanthine/guanine phosphoribosyltransferase [Methanoregulaceae archaeon PtaB.Bin056]